MWEIFLPIGETNVRESEHVHTDVDGVLRTERDGCYTRLLIACLR